MLKACIPAEFAEGSAFYNTLPRLPPVSSRNPDPAQANGTWNATTVEANLNWTASTDTELDHNEIRGVTGPDYDREDESNITSIPAAGPLLYATNYALGPPATPPATKSTSSSPPATNAAATPSPALGEAPGTLPPADLSWRRRDLLPSPPTSRSMKPKPTSPFAGFPESPDNPARDKVEHSPAILSLDQ